MQKQSLQQRLLNINPYAGYFLIPIIGIYLLRALRYLRSPFFSPDAENYYLPFAKKFLTIGPSLIFQKDSLKLSLGTYIWPAIFGADPSIIRYANLILGVFMVVLVYDISRLLHSKYAGLLSSFLFAMSPIIIFWIPSLLSEPPFIFFSLLFIWSLIKVTQKKSWSIPLCSFALTSSIFIRPVWLYPSILFLPVFALSFVFMKQQEQRKTTSRVILTIIIGLILPFMFIVRNQLKYNLPGIATGSGTTLFYGTNLFTGGYEPPIINLQYGIGSYSSPELEKLDFIESDKKLASVSKEHLRQMPIKDLVYWVITKFSWFSFLTPLETNFKMALIRALEFSLSLLGFIWAIREKKYLIITLGCAYILQTGQTIPALYNVRYSAGNLEPLLILLAPIGLVALLSSFKSNFISFIFYSFFSFTILLLALYAHFTLLPKIIFPKNMPYKVLYETKVPLSLNPGNITYSIPKISPIFALNTFIKIELAPVDKNILDCKDSFAAIENRRIGFDFKNMQENTVYIGAVSSTDNLIPDSPSTLTITSDCLELNKVQITKISYIEAMMEKYWNPTF